MGGSVKKVVIIGPESTGKSELSAHLANYYNTRYVPEYARQYLLTHGKSYTLADLTKIAEGQMASEDILTMECREKGKEILFIDTDLQVIKTWSEFVFNSCDNRILYEISKRKYDLFLLTNTDLPWVKDELREYPDHDTRLKLFHHYRDALINQSVPWVEISGVAENRLKQAKSAVAKMQESTMR